MHPWIQTILDICTNKKNENFNAFDEDPLAKSIHLQKHYYGEFSLATVQANTNMEDHSQVEVASNNALFLGVYDGHGGFEASRFISDNLFKILLRLAEENENNINESILKNAVSVTEEGFLDLVRESFLEKPMIGKVGSCCLAGIIWKGTLYIANLGDSRAVIGSLVDKKIFVQQLTRDHNVNNRIIREELKSLHPDDPNIVMDKNGNGSWRVKGIITVCRSIGDAYLKRPDFSFHESFPKFEQVPEPFNRSVLSSEPEMHFRVLTDSDKFLIFASDGLWDLLTNEQAAAIVSKNPRNGIAKRLLSTALAESARRRGITYKNLQSAAPGRDSVSRRSFHDDISVIVVFLDKSTFLRRRVSNISYKGSAEMPQPSDFERSRLTETSLQSLSPRSWAKLKQKFKPSSPRTPRTPRAQNPQNPEDGESSEAQLLPGESSRGMNRWESLKHRLTPNRK